MTMNYRHSCTLFLFSALALCACAQEPASSSAPPDGTPDAGRESFGEAHILLAVVPSGVQCIQITVLGSTTMSKTFSVTPGSGSVNILPLGSLPVGTVTITGQAYNAACSAISGQTATWVADKQTITVQAGTIASVTITLRPYNSVTATAAFLPNVASVAVGAGAIGLILSDGTVRAAGGQNALTLGGASFANVSALTNVAQLAFGKTERWTNGDFGCALSKSGTVSCWGDNTVGQLGQGNCTGASTTDHTLVVPGLSNITQIAAGYRYACALRNDGAVFCWGYNTQGQVGNGATSTCVPSPVQVTLPSGIGSVTAVAAGFYHTCVAREGEVFCWGRNVSGQLGTGTASTTPQLQPSAAATGLHAIRAIALGGYHTCAIRSDDTLFCWGFNLDGELGNGQTSDKSSPTQVTGVPAVEEVTATNYTTCARDTGGTVRCWGYDIEGNVGDGTGSTSGILNPTYVVGLPSSASIFGGGYDTCSVGIDLTIRCWGDGFNYQLGNGSGDVAWVPTLLGGTTGY
jgi:hypothetical protein